MEKTLRISDKELHSTLDEFLQESEKKEEPKIWNRLTITGIALLLISAAYTGYSILGATGILSGSVPFIYTVMKIAPYAGGTLLGVVLLTNFKTRKTKRAEARGDMQEKIKSRDKLDEFLYSSEEATSEKSPVEKSSLNTYQKLYKSRSDKKLFGVCGGLANYLGMNSTVLRIIFIAALFLSANIFLLIYLALGIIIPKEPKDEFKDFF